ncbi:MAG TPA: hypothetical protein VIJ34_09390 [Acidimicrobiales bacterium]
MPGQSAIRCCVHVRLNREIARRAWPNHVCRPQVNSLIAHRTNYPDACWPRTLTNGV